jgi:hypothetical protein
MIEDILWSITESGLQVYLKKALVFLLKLFLFMAKVLKMCSVSRVKTSRQFCTDLIYTPKYIARRYVDRNKVGFDLSKNRLIELFN